ncbi:MAG: endolytic transglycosylase MltG [Bacteroidales bacterium]|nr:endolytic transglycosylase MltG [Bacteroidales bacterium]
MNRKKRIGLAVAVILAALMAAAGGIGYRWLFSNNIRPDKPAYLDVPTGSSYEELLAQLDSIGLLKNRQSFRTVARLRHLPGHLKPGRYAVPCGSSNYTLTGKLRSGQQEAVRLRFNNIRTLPQLAGRISAQLETDSAELMELLQDEDLLARYGMTPVTAICLFLPNTYECWWNTSAPALLERMFREYVTFWNEKRMEKAAAIPLSPQEVMTLASIVEEENSRHEEQARIAGLYINRLRIGMKLQSDPTVKYALGDFGRKRLLYADLETDSPYNTYRYAGLPPGPIRMPSLHAIDAVLDYEHHHYLYMCAKEDFSGSHRFTASAAEHAANARRYHEALNRRQISK